MPARADIVQQHPVHQHQRHRPFHLLNAGQERAHQAARGSDRNQHPLFDQGVEHPDRAGGKMPVRSQQGAVQIGYIQRLLRAVGIQPRKQPFKILPAVMMKGPFSQHILQLPPGDPAGVRHLLRL